VAEPAAPATTVPLNTASPPADHMDADAVMPTRQTERRAGQSPANLMTVTSEVAPSTPSSSSLALVADRISSALVPLPVDTNTRESRAEQSPPSRGEEQESSEWEQAGAKMTIEVSVQTTVRFTVELPPSSMEGPTHSSPQVENRAAQSAAVTDSDSANDDEDKF
jgi:hypothetical protein